MPRQRIDLVACEIAVLDCRTANLVVEGVATVVLDIGTERLFTDRLNRNAARIRRSSTIKGDIARKNAAARSELDETARVIADQRMRCQRIAREHGPESSPGDLGEALIGGAARRRTIGGSEHSI